MRRLVRSPLLPVMLLGLAAAAPALGRYDRAPGFPWTRTESGLDTADAIAVDEIRTVWLAGTISRTWTGRDAELVVYTATTGGTPLSVTSYDRAGLDEGPPAIAVLSAATGVGSMPVETDAFLSFTSSAGGQTDLTMWHQRLGGPSCNTCTPFFEDRAGGMERAAPALVVDGSGSPYVCGTRAVAGVDQLWLVGYAAAPGTAWSWNITADLASGTAEAIEGRAVALEPDGAVWAAAAQGGDLVLMRWSAARYADSGPNDLKATPRPGWPRRYTTAAADDPRALVLDESGAAWIAGAIDGQAALWKFLADGSAAPGFPRVYAGAPSILKALARDSRGGVLATGSRGGDLLVLGVDADGTPGPGMPLGETAAPDTLDGRGIAQDADGAVWLAVTLTAAVPTTFTTAQQVWKYLYTPPPPPLAEGQVRLVGPGGAVLNLHRGETLGILALPPEPGDVTIRLLNLRGEALRVWRLPSSGRAMLTAPWDGRDADGRLVASGTYVVQVDGGGLHARKRTVVIRRP